MGGTCLAFLRKQVLAGGDESMLGVPGGGLTLAEKKRPSIAGSTLTFEKMEEATGVMNDREALRQFESPNLPTFPLDDMFIEPVRAAAATHCLCLAKDQSFCLELEAAFAVGDGELSLLKKENFSWKKDGRKSLFDINERSVKAMA